MATNRLHEQLAHMVALEDNIERLFARQLTKVGNHRDVADVIEGFRKIANRQKIALNERLNMIGDGITIPSLSTTDTTNCDEHVSSSALQTAYVYLNEAIIGYATLSIIAKRFRDSAIIGDGNTTDIADQHTRNYVAAVRSISHLLHDVIVGELDHDGHSCDCTCACCGIGLCICATYNRETLSNAWADAGPFADAGEVLVLQPKSGSPAAAAGVCQGDYIIAADGKELASYATLYEVADGHQTGETIELKVRRASGELTDISVTIA